MRAAARGAMGALVLVIALGGCTESGGGGRDAAPSAPDAFVSPGCSFEFGHTYIIDEIEVLPPGVGVDLDDDGTIDNELGLFGNFSNAELESSIETGVAIYLAEIRDWAGPPVANDDQVGFNLHAGTDADQPLDPSNNYGGEGEFLVFDDQFDVDCRALSGTDEASIEDGVLRARTPRWRLFFPGIGTVLFNDLRVELTFAPDLESFEILIGGSWTACTLENVTGAVIPGGSLLDAVVGFGLEVPDIDVDGDGLERVVGEDGRVARCIDGDGTVIDDPNCACDPRIADGWSVATRLHGLPATIVGVEETR